MKSENDTPIIGSYTQQVRNKIKTIILALAAEDKQLRDEMIESVLQLAKYRAIYPHLYYEVLAEITGKDQNNKKE